MADLMRFSLPSPSPPTSGTNTLIITPIPSHFFHPEVLSTLRHHFATYGEINQWVPLTGLSRIIIVYTLEEDAEHAKNDCDPIVIDSAENSPQCTLRVYRADKSPLIHNSSSSIPDHSYLRPPEIEKNFLISPPGSPPVGWEPVKEDPPNAAPLAKDLMVALHRLSMMEKGSGSEMLLDPNDESGVGVYLEFCGEDDDYETVEVDWEYGQTSPARMKWKPLATALPPMHATTA